ncbi:MAG: LamG domain-containing protein [Candidatus Latescibacteria bacterium]|nr:LamG domain-containing protein [Candidatus Latescibacterota bacterium]
MKRIFITVICILVAVDILQCSGGDSTRNPDLVAYWKFDDLTQNNETAPDATGNGHDGRVHGQKLVDGVIGKAMLFEGLDQIVETGDLGLKAPATVAFWLKTDDLFRDRHFFSQTEGSKKQAGALRLDGVQVEVWDGSEWQALINRDMRIKTWMHIAVVFDLGGKTLGYLNGDRQRLTKCGFDFDGVKAAIGAPFIGETGNSYTGELDDFRIYSRALSEDDIKALYMQGANR